MAPVSVTQQLQILCVNEEVVSHDIWSIVFYKVTDFGTSSDTSSSEERFRGAVLPLFYARFDDLIASLVSQPRTVLELCSACLAGGCRRISAATDA